MLRFAQQILGSDEVVGRSRRRLRKEEAGWRLGQHRGALDQLPHSGLDDLIRSTSN
ncbi:hypothetical protein D9M68_868150 [compost metagenome]